MSLHLLTPRQRAVVEHLRTGASNKHIARALGLTEGTIKSHLHRVYLKLEVRGRVALIMLLLQEPRP